MKKANRSLVHILLFLCAVLLVGSAVLIAVAVTCPLWLATVVAVAECAALTGACASFLRRRLNAMRTAVYLLPPEQADALAGELPTEQFQSVCAELAGTVKDLNGLAVERFLNRLLSDNAHTEAFENLREQLQSILHSSQFGYRWSHFVLIYIKFEDYSSYVLKNCSGHLLLEDFRKMYDVVNRSFSQQISRFHIVHSVEQKNACVLFVNLAATQPDTPQSKLDAMVSGLRDGCRNTAREIQDTFGLTLEIIISAPYTDITETHSIYEWMLIAKEYSDFINGSCVVLAPGDFTAFPTFSSEAPSEPLEKTYYSALLAEDFTRAEAALISLNRELLRRSSYNVNTLKRAVLMFLRTAEDFVLSSAVTPVDDSGFDWESLVTDCDSIDKLDTIIHTFFSHLVERSSIRNREFSSTAKRIINYLDEHYTDPNLSVNQVSDALSLSPSYISRVFKRETNMNVPDYIHEQRVRKAKELLTTTELSINEISEQVGYSTSWTMNRLFKRMVQMTPGAWRQATQPSKGVALDEI